ncbi:MAG: LysR family transcriptional regulator [Christensenellales bacterium]|jgi:DNA-binding transcriptional LysR family regulator
MTIRHLRIFVAVCEEGSITKAGHKLFMAQPTVSFAVSELEKHYGIRLFDRISRRLHLTDAGRRLLPYARHIVSMFDEMESGTRNMDDSGTLRIGTSITIGNCLLPGFLREFAKSKPGVTVRVQIDNSERIERAAIDNRIDFGLIEGVTHEPLLISEAFQDDELALLFAPGHRWAAQTSVAPEELKDEPFLMRERGSAGREILESALLLRGIEIEPAWESISTQAILQAVAGGFGVAVLPRLLAAPYLAQGAIATRPIEGVSLKRKFAVIYHKNKYITEVMQQFIDLCRGGMRDAI